MHLLPLHRCDDVPVPARPPVPDRMNIPGFESIRAATALCVVLLHACVPYLRHPMPGLVWPVRDGHSDAIDVLFWSLEIFVMPVFLVLAGFLAWRTLDSRGPSGLMRSRFRRLLPPLVFGVVVILPIDLYTWILGWVAEGVVPARKLRSLKIDGPLGDELWGLAHLWFLQYLLLYVAATAGWMAVRRRVTPLLRYHPGSLLLGSTLGMIAAIVLAIQPEIVWGFQHAFYPVPGKWVYSGTFFVGGLWIAIRDPHLDWLRSRGSRMIAPAILLAMAGVGMGRWHLGGGEGVLAATVLAALTVAAAWMITLAIFGAAARVRSVGLTMRYVAAASFWIYLVHHPILGIVHLDLKTLLPGWDPLPKTVLAFALTTTVSLLTYEAFVRKTRLGRWLGFTWRPNQTESSSMGRSAVVHDTVKREQTGIRTATDDACVAPARRAA